MTGRPCPELVAAAHRPTWRPGWRLPAALALALSLAGAGSAAVPVAAQSPFPPRQGLVANGTDMVLSEPRLTAEFQERFAPHGLEGVIVLVDDCRPDPESYLDLALVHYGLAPHPGGMYDDSVAWLVCREPRFVGFFFAAGNPRADRLDADRATAPMVQALRDGNVTGAFTASFQEVERQLTAGGAGAGDAGLVAAAAALAAAGGGWLLLRRRRQAAVETGPVSGAEALRDFERRLAALGQRLKPESQALARLVLAHESMGDEAILDLHRRHQAMVERRTALEQRSEQLRAGIAAGEGTGEEIDRHLAEPRAELEALEVYVEQLERDADHAEYLEDRAPVLLVAARGAVEAATASYARDAEGLDLPPAAAAVAVAERLADDGEAALTAGQRVSAGRLAEGAQAVAEQVGALPAALRAADEAVGAVALLWPRLESYAESSWSDVRGNGSEAEESLDAAAAMLGRLAEARPEAFGVDVAAGALASLAEVRAEIERAERLVAAVRQRLAFLDRAREEADGALDGVRAALAAARAHLRQPDVDPDVSPAPDARLDAAERELEALRLAMHEPRPDWIAVLRRAHDAARAVDEAAADVRAQQERMDALRRQLAADKSDAEAALDRAERYLASHGGDVGAEGPERVGEARAALGEAAERAAAAERWEDAARAEALDRAAEGYRRGTRLADTAYDVMAAAVARAEKARPVYRPRSEWTVPRVPASRGPGPIIFGGFNTGSGSRPSRGSQWGTRPSGSRSGGRPSSTRRGGGRGW